MPVTAANLETEVTFVSGVAADGTAAAVSYWTWDKNSADSAVYLPTSSAAKWGQGQAGTPGGTVTYAFDDASGWTVAERSSFLGAMALWSGIADIHFQQTGPASAQVVFMRTPGSGDAVTTRYPHTAVVGGDRLASLGTPDSGTVSHPIQIRIDTTRPAWSRLGSFQDQGGYGIATVVHEMGHVLGLGHGQPFSANVASAETKEQRQFTAFDTTQWTIMSYINGGDQAAAFYEQEPSKTGWGRSADGAARAATTPGMVDILAAQRLYGVSKESQLGGNQVFGFHTTLTGEVRKYFDFTANENASPVVTLFSTGTNNTLDLSGFHENGTVDLRPGTFSSAHGMVNNIGIALGVAIDRVIGGAGDDRFTLNGNGNMVDGGGGTNTVVVGRMLGAVGHLLHGQQLLLRHNMAVDRLLHIQTLRFTDGTLALGTNPLIDDVFYAQHNGDVFQAGVAAGDHYARSGWHEGRDPNALLSTKAYLATNADVAAAGMDPITHYDQFGWHEGRDPSAAFSTSLYLLRNPDVAASGMDPLAHYLQFGQAEGRRAAPVVDPARLQGGFDPGFYLLANPDVAAAGLDPLAHWQAHGEAENRDPDSFFSTSAYLSANPDVAAAGVNPLDHYMQSGWLEGRNPSSHFNTQAYLAHNPDVAAASAGGLTNPLLHFLQHGLVEGRSGYGDSV